MATVSCRPVERGRAEETDQIDPLVCVQAETEGRMRLRQRHALRAAGQRVEALVAEDLRSRDRKRKGRQGEVETAEAQRGKAEQESGAEADEARNRNSGPIGEAELHRQDRRAVAADGEKGPMAKRNLSVESGERLRPSSAIANTSLLNVRDGSTPYSYWRIGTSDGDAPRNHWKLMREGNYVAIGWDTDDLSQISNDKEGKEQIYQVLLAHYPNSHHAPIGKAAQQLFNFRWVIAENDLVLASDGASVLGIGRVVGDYIYDPSNDFPHHRPVEWLSLDEWTQPDQQSSIEGKLTTVYRMRKESNLLEAEKRIYGREPIITYIPPLHSPELNSQSTPVPRLTGIPARIQAILERKGQVILYGPPGTGKTYWAENSCSRAGSPFKL